MPDYENGHWDRTGPPVPKVKKPREELDVPQQQLLEIPLVYVSDTDLPNVIVEFAPVSVSWAERSEPQQ